MKISLLKLSLLSAITLSSINAFAELSNSRAKEEFGVVCFNETTKKSLVISSKIKNTFQDKSGPITLKNVPIKLIISQEPLLESEDSTYSFEEETILESFVTTADIVLERNNNGNYRISTYSIKPSRSGKVSVQVNFADEDKSTVSASLMHFTVEQNTTMMCSPYYTTGVIKPAVSGSNLNK